MAASALTAPSFLTSRAADPPLHGANITVHMKTIIFFLALTFSINTFGQSSDSIPPVDTSMVEQMGDTSNLEGSVTPDPPKDPNPQPPTDPKPSSEVSPDVDEEQLNKWYMAIFGILSVVLPLLLGVLAPQWAWVKDDAKRDKIVKALTVAIVLGVAVYTAGFANVWEIAVTWALFSFIGYDKVLRAANVRTKTAALNAPSTMDA